MIALFALPIVASAGLFEWFGTRAQANQGHHTSNIRTMALLEGTHNPNPNLAQGGGDIAIVDGGALASETSPLSGEGYVTNSSADQISLYVVREGDTLSGIASMFGVTMNTIRWANDLSTKHQIQPGEKLVILPITGVKHIVKKGDTLNSIVKKYKADSEEVLQFNGLADGSELAIGMELIIPNGEVIPPTPAAIKKGAAPAKSYGGGPSYSGYYMRPIAGGTKTQGIHGYNGVDLAAPVGTPIYAAAAGEVIISRSGGYSGGYGNYVVLRHDNGTQTLYAHNSSNTVSEGQTVTQGAVIGYVGLTGKTTGSHVHFEIRGAANPF